VVVVVVVMEEEKPVLIVPSTLHPIKFDSHSHWKSSSSREGMEININLIRMNTINDLLYK